MVGIRKRSEAVRHKNTPTCSAYEYRLPTGEIDSALIELSGRYPEKGWTLNTACTSLIHIIRGNGAIYFEEGEALLGADDQIVIERGDKYVLEGNLTLSFSAAPAWTLSQTRIVE